MEGDFFNNKLKNIDVLGNGQSIYFIKENKEIIGMNYLESSNIYLSFKKNKINNINYKTSPYSITTPLEDISEENDLSAANPEKQKELLALLKQWKITPVDLRAQELWDTYTHYKKMMFAKTHSAHAPWHIIEANPKMNARLEALELILNTIPYESKN